jgi:uncharacterized membrane protein (UPF0127 family)
MDFMRILLLALILATGAAWAQEPPAFERAQVTVVSAQGRFLFDVEVADDDRERAYGLQFREDLAPTAGMLFDFGEPRPVAMWMKNTPISLDMLFVTAEGAVANVARDTVPYSLRTLSSAGPVRWVLEVPAGTAARLGIGPGARLIPPPDG